MVESLSLTERLAQHLSRPVTAEARERARLHLLDWLGCVAGGRRTEVAKVVEAAEPDVLTRAALLGNVLEMDDVHRAALLHPGPVVWPAALSAIRDEHGNIEDLLDGAVRGYEAVIAVGATLDAHHYAYWHNSSTAGGFGAVAAAASIYGLTREQTTWALGNSGSIAGGFWQMRHSSNMTKQLHFTHAALTGLWAARLARRGFTGPIDILEGPQGLYAATTRAPRPLELGANWRIHEVSFKPWASCRHTHPAIDAVLTLKGSTTLDCWIRIETYADAIAFCDRPQPTAPAEAKFSIQHAVAVAAVRGAPRPADFEPDAIADPRIAAVRSQVELIEAPEFTARYPAHFGARATCAGEIVELADARGDPERPLSPDGIVAKARELIAWGGLAEREAERAVELALRGSGEAAPLLALLDDWL